MSDRQGDYYDDSARSRGSRAYGDDSARSGGSRARGDSSANGRNGRAQSGRDEYYDDPVYTLDDQELDGDDYRDDWSDWEEDIPDTLDIDYEGDIHRHHRSGIGSDGGSAAGSRRSGRHSGSHGSGRRAAGEDGDDTGAGRRARRSRQKEAYVDRNGRVHGRAPANDTTRHSHRRVHGWKKALIITGIVLVSAVALVLIGWRVLEAVGRGRLYQEGNAVPTLVSDESETELDEIESVTWEADWIRYNGTVYDYDEDVLTFLVMGIDHTDEVEDTIETALDGGQADALFLLVMDPSDAEISILAINRHTMTDIDIYDEDNNYLMTGEFQICLQHAYGDGKEQSCERQVEAVSNLFYGLTINGYAAINMGAIPTINNSIGGVTLEALQDIPVSSRDSSFLDTYYTDSARDLYAGETYTLSGTEAYWYTKYRDITVSDSAGGRLQRQKQYLKVFMSDMKSAVSDDLTVAIDLYNAIAAYMVTDIDLSEFTYLASNVTGYSLNLDEFYEIDGELVTGETGTATGFDEFYIDEDSLYEVMLELFYDEVEL